MFDIAVIGLGPAGLEVVDIALKNNLSVIAFEEKELGGTCLNVGCIPTKSILHCASFYNDLKNSNKLGINCNNYNYNWKDIIDRQKNIVSKFTKSLNLNLSKNIKLVRAKASICVSDNDIEIYADDNMYEAKNIIIATGSKPNELPNLKFDNNFILNSDDLFNLEELPKSIAIVGSGAIGLEWAYILSSFGVEVKLIEKAQALAPLCDIEIQKRVERILKSLKIEFYKDTYIQNTDKNKIILSNGKEFQVDKILCATGRTPKLPEIKISGCSEDYKLIINEDYSTDFNNIYAIGDVNSESMLAHSASYQAKILMDSILNQKTIIKKNSPSVIYIKPEIASIGIKEQDIINSDEYEIKKILLGSIAKSWCDEASDGIIKVIIHKDTIVGAHVVSPEASALIATFNVLIENKIKINEITRYIFPHPSYCEAILEVLKNDK